MSLNPLCHLTQSREVLAVDHLPLGLRLAGMTIENSAEGIAITDSQTRWFHADLGLALPSHVIPLTEETGLAETVGAWAFSAVNLKQAPAPEIRMMMPQSVRPEPHAGRHASGEGVKGSRHRLR